MYTSSIVMATHISKSYEGQLHPSSFCLSGLGLKGGGAYLKNSGLKIPVHDMADRWIITLLQPTHSLFSIPS